MNRMKRLMDTVMKRVTGKGNVDQVLKAHYAECERMLAAGQYVFEEGLPLPPTLVRLIETGKWPMDRASINDPRPTIAADIACRISGNAHESGIWLMPPPFGTIKGGSKAFYVDMVTNVYEMDYGKSLRIADFGIGADSEIILNYQQSLDSPNVMFLKFTWVGELPDMSPDKLPQLFTWVKSHASFDEFARDIGLL